MRQDQRAPFVEALEQARVSAYPPGEFAGQESFMLASEIRALARSAGIGPGVRVLDLCCGIAGPGRLITAESGCDYLGVDYSESAIGLARELAAARGLSCRFEAGHVPPVPDVEADVVLLLETILAFEDKAPLLKEVSRVLRPGGRFALTFEEGQPLTPAERASMPDADTVWLTPLPDLLGLLDDAGLRVRSITECSRSHRATALSLLRSFTADAPAIAEQIGQQALDDLLLLHRFWVSWLATGRVRKFALVADAVN